MLKSTYMDMRFDQRDLKYKSPLGAVPAGTCVRFFAETFQSGVAVTLRLWVDGAEKLAGGVRVPGGFEFRYTPERPGLVWYYFVIDGPGGRSYYSGTAGEGREYPYPPESYQLTVYDPGFTVPAWFSRAPVYQIFPDRFCRSGGFLGLEEHKKLGHRISLHRSWDEPVDYLPLPGQKDYSPCDFYGGSLYGIAEKLPYLASLGVGCIYLNPVFLSDSNHRYNTADYLTVDPMLGGDKALALLAEKAGEQGIRLMLDGVFSHTGDDSLYFDRLKKYGGACADPNSRYREWYDFQSYPDKYRCWWGFKTLPEINELTPSYMEFIAGVLEKYAGMGITSWRLDVADELPDEFIAFLRQKLKGLDPEGVLIGEVWEEASDKHSMGGRRKYVDGGELDGVMNYPLREVLRRFFTGKSDGGAAADSVLALLENYPRPFLTGQLNLMGSHDTVRAINAFGGAPDRFALSRERQAGFRLSDGDLAKGRRRYLSAYALAYSMPGAPCIYYGDEAGLNGMADPFCRGTYPWGGEDGGLVEFFRALGRIRRDNPGLWNGNAAVYGKGDLFAVCREGVITAVNRGGETLRAHIEAGDFYGNYEVSPFSGGYTEALTGERFGAGDGLDISVPPMGRLILIKD